MSLRPKDPRPRTDSPIQLGGEGGEGRYSVNSGSSPPRQPREKGPAAKACSQLELSFMHHENCSAAAFWLSGFLECARLVVTFPRHAMS
jgi:hypothetical protein